MQTHFVVAFDHDTGKFEIDWETTLAKFRDGAHYDEANETWKGLEELELDDIELANWAGDCLQDRVGGIICTTEKVKQWKGDTYGSNIFN